MKIKARCKFKLESDGWGFQQPYLIVKFKDPNHIFKVKKKILLEDETRYKTCDLFLVNGLRRLDKDEVVRIVNKTVLYHFNDMRTQQSNMEKTAIIEHKIRDFNKEKFEVEVEIEE